MAHALRDSQATTAARDAYTTLRKFGRLRRRECLRYEYESISQGNPNGNSGTENAVATLNLETGRYEMAIHGHGKGVYEWKVKGGLELWRDITFSAQAKLVTATCPASLETVSTRVVNQQPKPQPMEGLRPCVIKVKPKGNGSDPGYEFIQNPASATSPQGCVVVHEEPMPNGAEKLSERLPGEK